MTICLVPRLQGVGGMVSFQHRLAQKLQDRGVQVAYDLNPASCSAVLVVGGTRQIAGLWRIKRRGVRIVQRLDGMNWLHRLRLSETHKIKGRKVSASLRHYLRAEYGNWLLALIRRHLADCIVYQSEFALQWWERRYGATRIKKTVIYNGVDLELFSPTGSHVLPPDRWRLLLVEGSLMGGYEQGLESAVSLGMTLAETVSTHPDLSIRRPVELLVAGRVSQHVRQAWDERMKAPAFQEEAFSLRWAGLVPGERIPELDRSAHLLYSADINAACPNSVIEALACGLPVAAFATGALPELVQGESGRVVAYGGDPWKLDPPDIPSLSQAALKMLENLDHHRFAARERAEAAFDLEKMADLYYEALAHG
jgi:glycosyltransferase involved in cell wall biosynthesis